MVLAAPASDPFPIQKTMKIDLIQIKKPNKPGSERAKHPTLSPFKNGLRNSSFCFSLPYFEIGPI